MRISDNDILDTGIKVIGAGLFIFFFKKIAAIFKGPDEKFSQAEFGKFVGFWFFLGAATYIIQKEGSRPPGTDHVFSEIWLFIVFGSLLTVLHLDHALDKITKMIEMLLKMKAKMVVQKEESITVQKTTAELQQPEQKIEQL